LPAPCDVPSMPSIDEYRVYDDATDEETVFVAADAGVVRVAASGGHVGEFALDRECSAHDLAVGPDWLAVATDEDVLLRRDDSYEPTGFGPATAVGAAGDDLLAADPDAVIGRVVDAAADPTDWLEIADVDATVRAIDGDFVAAADGVYRVTVDGLDHAGLDDARDVSADGVPLVATGSGLYRLGNGWLRDHDAAFDVVEGVADDGRLAAAHAAADDTLYRWTGDDWQPRDCPVAPAAVCHGDTTYVAATDGTLATEREDGWSHQHVGVPGVHAIAVR
jgi:hypothetical protein